MAELSIQERHAPRNRCFGCGPANERGLRIRSFPVADSEAGELECEWQPEDHHQAFGNVLNGGIIGTLLDCHSNWTAACFIMERRGVDDPPVTVTLDFHVKLKRPTATDQPVHLWARALPTDKEDRVLVEATLTSQGKVTATCTGTFVAVKPDHPAYHQR